ncbi:MULTISPECIES: hypothetical protein [unclassified Leptolyngbya]|jgi:Ca2+-binding RTX toxin-like protein|uniref:calcium-binding protein n=1 Tax=unclassified Leptolyngbya TaxID=2650499 RepID=UPI0016847425|nr:MULTISPECIES: hypothetical protein [unclassified Leptolyngbya]MBD1910659.1 hypothetical protein [Leptolyngbya sp. FACHB-8]MBD2158418.1 hypothetical protein [Leptolyngbya sp. FACHB-16]
MANITGNSGNNTIDGTDQNDKILGGAGHDVIDGGSGDDLLKGQKGNDFVFGGAGDDTILGDDHNYKSSDGHDILWGGSGDDVISGGGGDDMIRGSRSYYDAYEREYDVLTGGKGNDMFMMTDEFGNQAYLGDDLLNTQNSAGFALITDFQASMDSPKDTIQLDGFAAHYRLIPVFWGQQFGKANTSSVTDVALVSIGVNQDQQDVVAVLQDVSTQFLANPTGYLNNNNVFQFLG